MDFTITGHKENGLQGFYIDDWNILEVDDDEELYTIEDSRREGYEEMIFTYNGKHDYENSIDWMEWIQENYEYDEDTFCIVQVRQRRSARIIIQDDGTWEPDFDVADDLGELATFVIQNGEVKECQYSYES